MLDVKYPDGLDVHARFARRLAEMEKDPCASSGLEGGNYLVYQVDNQAIAEALAGRAFIKDDSTVQVFERITDRIIHLLDFRAFPLLGIVPSSGIRGVGILSVMAWPTSPWIWVQIAG